MLGCGWWLRRRDLPASRTSLLSPTTCLQRRRLASSWFSSCTAPPYTAPASTPLLLTPGGLLPTCAFTCFLLFTVAACLRYLPEPHFCRRRTYAAWLSCLQLNLLDGAPVLRIAADAGSGAVFYERRATWRIPLLNSRFHGHRLLRR